MVQQPCDKQPCRARNYQRKFRALPGRDGRQAERVHKLRIMQQDVCKQDGRSAATDKVYERTLGRCEEDRVPSECWVRFTITTLISWIINLLYTCE